MVGPLVNWYLYYGDNAAVEGRRLVNEWYAQSSVQGSANFINRLRSTRDIHHKSALDELYIDHLLGHVGEVKYEEGPARPDFCIYRSGVLYACLEVLSLFRNQEDENRFRYYGRIADGLNRKVPLTTHYVDFNVVSATRTPSVNKLAEFVTTEIQRLNDEEINDLGQTEAVYVDQDIWVDFNFYRCAPRPECADDRIVGGGISIGGGIVSTGSRLKQALGHKSGGRYDIAETPFAIVAFLHDEFSNVHQVSRALYGQPTVDLPSGRWIRRNDGLFGPHINGGKNSRISAVFVVPPWAPWAGDPPVLRFDNLYAAREFPNDVLRTDFHLHATSSGGGESLMAWSPEPPGGNFPFLT